VLRDDGLCAALNRPLCLLHHLFRTASPALFLLPRMTLLPIARVRMPQTTTDLSRDGTGTPGCIVSSRLYFIIAVPHLTPPNSAPIEAPTPFLTTPLAKSPRLRISTIRCCLLNSNASTRCICNFTAFDWFVRRYLRDSCLLCDAALSVPHRRHRHTAFCFARALNHWRVRGKTFVRLGRLNA